MAAPTRALTVILACALAASPPVPQAFADDPLRPFLVRHCLECHGAQMPKGDFRIDRLSTHFADRAIREKWLSVLKRVEYLAFYSEGQIQPTVPKIVQVNPEVVIQRGLHDGPLGELIQRILEDGNEFRRAIAMVFLLSAPADAQTIKLDRPVKNNLNAAFVQGQRYVSLAALRKAKRTSELEEKVR